MGIDLWSQILMKSRRRETSRPRVPGSLLDTSTSAVEVPETRQPPRGRRGADYGEYASVCLLVLGHTEPGQIVLEQWLPRGTS